MSLEVDSTDRFLETELAVRHYLKKQQQISKEMYKMTIDYDYFTVSKVKLIFSKRILYLLWGAV